MLSPNIVLIIWRELFEAFLIIAAVQAFLSRHAPRSLVRLLAYFGAALGVGLSLLLGLGVQTVKSNLSGPALDYFQTSILFLSAILMAHMCLWMKVHGQHLRSELGASVAAAVAKSGEAATLTFSTRAAVVLLVTLALAREGFEVVVYLLGMGMAQPPLSVLSSGLMGLALAGLSAMALSRGLHLIQPRHFLQLTGAFLLVTAASMVLTGVTRLLQAGVLPALIDPLYDLTWLLDDRSTFGHLVQQLTGYQSAPALTTVLAYLGFWGLYGGAILILNIKSMPRRDHARQALTALALLVALLSLGAFLAATGARAEVSVNASSSKSRENLKTKLTGYGDLKAAYYDYGSNSTLKNGSPKDSRVGLDATRFVTKLEGFFLPHAVEFEAEIEFEHGGTGAAKSLEYEESGEYETEVSHGGEIFLEEFYLKKFLSADLVAAVGRIKVGVGLTSQYSLPTDYLAVSRAEAEVHLVPESWTELGAEMRADLGQVRILGQIVNGLDSTGFSSQYWVASGHQQRFEEISGTDPAAVVRADVVGIPGAVFGGAVYYGGTSRNRPQPDLAKTCAKSNESQVAPCGYVEAPVTIIDAHGRYKSERLRASAVILHGSLKNAGKISERNASLPTALQVFRSPVADEALALSTEWGYDVSPWLGLAGMRRLEPFARYDWYDTMYKAKSGQLKDPRFERHLLTAGLSYVVDDCLFVKGDLSRRTYRAAERRAETTLSLGTGFIF